MSKALVAAAGLLFAMPALAAEGNGRSGMALPGAAPTAHTTGEIALGSGLAVGEEGPVEDPEMRPPEWAGSVDLVFAPGDRFAIEAQGAFTTESLLSFAGARYVLWRNDRWAVAPWAGAMWLQPADDTGWDLIPTVGAAVDYRGDKLGFDASVPTVGVLVQEGGDTWVLPAVVFGEIGLSWHFTDATSLRVGMLSFFPTLRWRHELGPVFYELDTGGVGVGYYQARVGARL